jgi:hypothetical protein
LAGHASRSAIQHHLRVREAAGDAQEYRHGCPNNPRKAGQGREDGELAIGLSRKMVHRLPLYQSKISYQRSRMLCGTSGSGGLVLRPYSGNSCPPKAFLLGLVWNSLECSLNCVWAL